MKVPPKPASYLFVAALLLAATSWSAARAQTTFNTAAGLFTARVTSLRDMPFRTVVRQQYDFSCGSAALSTLLRHHYGRDIGEAEVFQAMYAVGDQPKIRQVGFSLLDMKAYLKSIGLNADGYRQPMADLLAARAPAIAVIKVGAYRHFVVVKGVAGGKVLVGDPAQGLKVYSTPEFAKIWNGVVFVIHPEDAQGRFNRSEEWAMLGGPKLEALDDSTLASFTRALPPIYQITPFRVAGAAP